MEIKDIKVSFAITTHNETDSLTNLLAQISTLCTVFDEVVIIDDFSTNDETKTILDTATKGGAKIFQHALNSDFATHKNFLTEKCRGDYIFNIDADELLSEKLASTFREILSINPDVEMHKLPRINKVDGLTLDHIKKWGWQISTLRTEIEKRVLLPESDEFKVVKSSNMAIKEEGANIVEFYTPIVNFPDYQSRIYKRLDYIRWQNTVHETLIGFKKFAKFPAVPIYSLIHHKKIDNQQNQNDFYATIKG